MFCCCYTKNASYITSCKFWSTLYGTVNGMRKAIDLWHPRTLLTTGFTTRVDLRPRRKVEMFISSSLLPTSHL